jgi:hypothetical protein
MAFEHDDGPSGVMLFDKFRGDTSRGVIGEET